MPIFTIDRTFNAPRDLVWDAWTKPELVAQWFGPKGSACTILKHEFYVGGVVHSRIMSTEMGVIYGKFTFQEITPKEKLVWLHSFSDEGGVNLTRHPFAAQWPIELLTTVTFKENGKKTDIHLTWVPNNATPEEIAIFREAMPGMQQGWGGSFEQLDAFIAKKAAA